MTATHIASAAAVCQVCHDAIFPSVFLLSLRNLAAHLRLHTLSFVRWGSHTADEYSTCGLSRLYTHAPVSLQVSGFFLPKPLSRALGRREASVADRINPVNILYRTAFGTSGMTSVEVKGPESKFIRANIKIYFSYHYLIIHCHLIFKRYQLIILIAGPACSTK